MRRRIIVPALMIISICTGCAQSGAEATLAGSAGPTQVATIPPDGPLIAPFEPAFPCELQNDMVTVSDEEYCRSERITEVVVAEGEGALFIQHTQHFGYGCWSGINVYHYALHVCDLASGERIMLTDHATTPPVPSPDGAWLAYGDIDTQVIAVSIYKIRADGTVLQRLDIQGLPEATVGVNVLGWSADGEWVEVSLWDGTADGWQPYRIKADGSGEYENLP